MSTSINELSGKCKYRFDRLDVTLDAKPINKLQRSGLNSDIVSLLTELRPDFKIISGENILTKVVFYLKKKLSTFYKRVFLSTINNIFQIAYFKVNKWRC